MDCYEKAGPPPEKEPPPPKRGDRREVVIINAADVRIRAVRWLWKPWLPLGKVTLLAGAPGQGKSQLTAFFAAMTSVAGFYPSDLDGPGNTLILTAEDDLDDTVVPRLIAAGAALRHVDFINMRQTMPSGLTSDGLIYLPGDVETLHDRLRRGDVRLVIFDPVASFIGREHNAYVNQDVRSVLDPLVALARAYMAAIVIILHLNKSEAKTWAQKIAESHGFQAVARTVLALAADPEDEDGDYGVDKILASTKLNVARRDEAIRLKIKGAVVFDNDANPVETSCIEVTGSAKVYADDLLAGADQRLAYGSAREWVEDYLLGDWRKVGDMISDAIKAGHSERTLKRVRKEICQVRKQPGVKHGAWWAALKTVDESLEDALARARAHDAPFTGTLGPLGTDKEVKGAKEARKPGYARAREAGALEDNGHQADDLEWYRRQRDRMLGERDDDD